MAEDPAYRRTNGGGAFAFIIHVIPTLIGEGMTLFHNLWGTSLFGASFFSITGLHLSHVIGGVIALLVGTMLKLRFGEFGMMAA